MIAPLGYARWDAETQRHASLGETNFTALQSFFSVPPPDDLKQRIGDLGIPVHVIGGSVDLLSGLDPVEALAGVFRNGSVEMIDASGHFPWVDQPEAFARAVRHWSSTRP